MNEINKKQLNLYSAPFVHFYYKEEISPTNIGVCYFWQTMFKLLKNSNNMYHIQHSIHSFLWNKCENVILLPAILLKSLKLDLWKKIKFIESSLFYNEYEQRMNKSLPVWSV